MGLSRGVQGFEDRHVSVSSRDGRFRVPPLLLDVRLQPAGLTRSLVLEPANLEPAVLLIHFIHPWRLPGASSNMSPSYTPTSRTRVTREPERAVYDRAVAYQILDEGFLCHVGFVADGQPFVIPTSYGRNGDDL